MALILIKISLKKEMTQVKMDLFLGNLKLENDPIIFRKGVGVDFL